LLDKCSGWPMMCAIETPESQAELAARLAAWCVVEVDDQRFNFRFPDTRRLPAIFDALTPTQRAEFAGPRDAVVLHRPGRPMARTVGARRAKRNR
jgi:hypothetical protein